MKLERANNAKRNVIYGTALKLYQIIMPFVLRTLMIYLLGIEYVGLNSLFLSILQVLNLAELGVGSAMVFSMYKPIADQDTNTICALMNLYRKYYRIIGFIILVAGVALSPVLPSLIKSDLPQGIDLYALYYLNLGATVLSYWLFAYKNCLFSAHQRTDIVSKITLVVSSFEYLCQIMVLVLFRDYYLYLIIRLFSQALINICTAIVAKKYYPDYKASGILSRDITRDINKRIRDLFTAKIGGVIVNSADSIVISAYLGLNLLAIYNNYYYILTAVIGIVGVVFTSCTAGIGNSIITETVEKNLKDLNKFTLLICWIVGVCVNCLLALYQPFMEIWTGKENLLELNAVICFCIYFFVYEIASLLIVYKDAAGMWHEDRFRPLITAVLNLILNLILVRYIQIFGVLLSTVLTFSFIGIPWLLRNLFNTVFKTSMMPYVEKLLYYTVVTFISTIITYFICSFVGEFGWFVLIGRGIVAVLVPNIVFFLSYCKFKEFLELKMMFLRIVRRDA